MSKLKLTIPSGIITTHPISARELIKNVPEFFLTTKSTGVFPRIVPTGEMLALANPPEGTEFANREPIITAGPYGMGNAVGLSNPGKREARKEILNSEIPKERIRASIFGRNPEEFAEVAETLENCVSALEENDSCPHSKGHGISIGADPEAVRLCAEAVTSRVNIPVWVKFGLMPNLLDSVKAALEGGAYGIVLLNTEGPYPYTIDGNPILYNGVGGMSGPSLFPKLIASVKMVRKRFGTIPISACGGIQGAREINELRELEVYEYGIGTALAGMTWRELVEYFKTVVKDCERGTDNASGLLKKIDMTLKEAVIKKVHKDSCDFGIYETDRAIDASPGQFAFLFLPGKFMPNGKPGEKPFSILDNDPLTFAVQTRGYFTRVFNGLEEGEGFYFRGPYGQSPKIEEGRDVVLVGGGCGIAGLYFFAKKFSETNRIITLLGAKDKNHIPYLREFEKVSEVKVATEDGSLGKKGLVKDLLNEFSFKAESYFFNCGPRTMVESVLPFELIVSAPERVYSSVDYMTRCGVGICGSCIDEEGRRTCKEGPFMNP